MSRRTMRQNDDRFLCPLCTRPIEIKFMTIRHPGSATACVAVCAACERAYTQEEWRVVRGPHRVPEQRDSGFDLPW